MTCYQVNLAPNVTVHLGGVYELPSGRYVRVLNQTNLGWYVEAVSVRDMQALPSSTMDLTGYFIWFYGNLCWTAEQWAGRVVRVANEMEAVRLMRERRDLAASQDIARAKEIDRAFALQQISDRNDARQTMRLLAA